MDCNYDLIEFELNVERSIKCEKRYFAMKSPAKLIGLNREPFQWNLTIRLLQNA